MTMRYFRSTKTGSVYNEDEMSDRNNPNWEQVWLVTEDPPAPELPEVTQAENGGYTIDGHHFALHRGPEFYTALAEEKERMARRYRAAAKFLRERREAAQKAADDAKASELLGKAREALTQLGLLVPSAVVVPVLDAIDEAEGELKEVPQPW